MDRSGCLPNMSKAVRSFFACPAGSHSVEQDFCTAGNIGTAHRASMGDNTMSQLIFTNRNFDLLRLIDVIPLSTIMEQATPEPGLKREGRDIKFELPSARVQLEKGTKFDAFGCVDELSEEDSEQGSDED